MRREIIVAFDGSAHSCGAIKWAAQECRAQRMELTLCHVWDGPRAEREAAITEQQRKLAGRVLFDGVGLAERLLPGRDVRSILARGTPGPELVSLSRTAEMLVVGSRGLGGVAGLLLGSVSAHVAAHAICPVLVIPQAEPASRPCPATVVVGVDGSTGSLAALRFALGHARIHRLPVHAIHARAETSPRPEQEIQQWVAETMAALPRNHSSLVVTTSTLSEPTLAALLPHSRHASLLAVGSRGLGRVRAQILGSVSQALLRRASCPVAIVKHHH